MCNVHIKECIVIISTLSSAYLPYFIHLTLYTIGFEYIQKIHWKSNNVFIFGSATSEASNNYNN